MKKVMCVFGTRPEAIKMCPLVKELEKTEGIETVVCLTGTTITSCILEKTPRILMMW